MYSFCLPHHFSGIKHFIDLMEVHFKYYIDIITNTFFIFDKKVRDKLNVVHTMLLELFTREHMNSTKNLNWSRRNNLWPSKAEVQPSQGVIFPQDKYIQVGALMDRIFMSLKVKQLYPSRCSTTDDKTSGNYKNKRIEYNLISALNQNYYFTNNYYKK